MLSARRYGDPFVKLFAGSTVPVTVGSTAVIPSALVPANEFAKPPFRGFSDNQRRSMTSGCAPSNHIKIVHDGGDLSSPSLTACKKAAENGAKKNQYDYTSMHRNLP